MILSNCPDFGRKVSVHLRALKVLSGLRVLLTSRSSRVGMWMWGLFHGQCGFWTAFSLCRWVCTILLWVMAVLRGRLGE